MTQMVVRNLDDDVKLKLQQRAKQHGRSTEEEVREILREAVRSEPQKPSLSASACAPCSAISGSKRTFSNGVVNRHSRQHFDDARRRQCPVSEDPHCGRTRRRTLVRRTAAGISVDDYHNF
jgi:plasmid stability protein